VSNQQDYVINKGAQGDPVFHEFGIFVKNPNVGCHEDKVDQNQHKTCAPNAVPSLT